MGTHLYGYIGPGYIAYHHRYEHRGHPSATVLSHILGLAYKCVEASDTGAHIHAQHIPADVLSRHKSAVPESLERSCKCKMAEFVRLTDFLRSEPEVCRIEVPDLTGHLHIDAVSIPFISEIKGRNAALPGKKSRLEIFNIVTYRGDNPHSCHYDTSIFVHLLYFYGSQVFLHLAPILTQCH